MFFLLITLFWRCVVFRSGHTSIGKLFKYDQTIFENNYYSNEAKLIFYTHAIEKGLSHAKFREGFGLKVLVSLRNVMEIIKDKNSIEYVNALSTLKEYFGIHKGLDISKQEIILGKKILDEVQKTKSCIGGSKTISKESKENNSKTPFDQLMLNRYSVREYANTPVLKKDVIEAVRIAQKTPSACNRQSARVYIIQDSRIIMDILKLQGGFTGYETPPCLLLVTSDNKAYINANERHQGYIDGGFFTMSLLLALEFKSLAAVPLHTMFEEKIDIAIRKLLSIPNSELLIAFISIGNFRKENKVAKSFRYPIEKVVREIKYKKKHNEMNGRKKKRMKTK